MSQSKYDFETWMELKNLCFKQTPPENPEVPSSVETNSLNELGNSTSLINCRSHWSWGIQNSKKSAGDGSSGDEGRGTQLKPPQLFSDPRDKRILF